MSPPGPRAPSLSPGQGLALLAVEHLVVPAAVVALVGSLLFYLLDLRSIWVGGSLRLKVVALCLVAAAVLIVRYGRVHGDSDRQALYVGTLALASLLSLSAQPSPGGFVHEAWWAFPSLVLVAFGAWWLAARLASHLSLRPPRSKSSQAEARVARLRWAPPPPLTVPLELPPAGPPGVAMPGPTPTAEPPTDRFIADPLARLKRPDPPPTSEPPVGSPPTAEQSEASRPSAWTRRLEALSKRAERSAVLRLLRYLWRGVAGAETTAEPSRPGRELLGLIAPALLVFALGEPFMLRAEPEIGARAVLAMAAFLAASAVLLAAAAGLGGFVRVHSRGGRATPALVPLRVGLGGVLVVVALVAGLATPGIRFAGSGDIKSSVPDGSRGAWHSDDPDKPHSAQEARGRDREPGDAAKMTAKAKGQAKRGPSSSLSGARGLLASLSALGARLLPFVLGIAALVGLISLLRFRRPAVPSRKPHGAEHPARGAPADPRSLPSGSPEETVRGAYDLLLQHAAALGTPKPPEQTAREFARQLPSPLTPVASSVRDLTELYQRAAYSPRAVTQTDADAARAAIGQVARVRPRS